MTLESIRKLCLSLPGATEQIQWGKDLVFKVGGKMFCVCCTEPVAPPKVAMSFKCDEATFAELVERVGVIRRRTWRSTSGWRRSSSTRSAQPNWKSSSSAPTRS